MTPLPLAVTIAVTSFFLACCTALLLCYRKGRLAADALHLLERAEPVLLPPPVLPFVAAVPPLAAPPKLARVSGLTMCEAEDLLDWLEQHGCEERSLLCDTGASFAVEFRVDPAHVLPPTPHLPQASPLRRYTAG